MRKSACKGLQWHMYINPFMQKTLHVSAFLHTLYQITGVAIPFSKTLQCLFTLKNCI